MVKKTGKDALLLWCQKHVNNKNEYAGVVVSDFTKSWKDG